MIPRHEPPFGLGGLLSVVFRDSRVSQAALEEFCAEKFGVPEAVLLPSARSAILLALRAVAPSVDSVIGPAYTCEVVHQAMRLSGLPVGFIDSERDGYLMRADELCSAARTRKAIVLGEIYGLRYPKCDPALGGPDAPHIRIWDMAMCLPGAEDFTRLRTDDIAVISFGLGKCLYAGWGGLLLARSSGLAEKVRAMRRQCVGMETRKVCLRHALQVLASAAVHNRFLYGTGRKAAEWRNRRAAGASHAAGAPPGGEMKTDLSREWAEPMTPLNRKLALANLRSAAESQELRRRKAAAYYRLLKSSGLVFGIGADSLPESHFPIRVAASVRNRLRQQLARRAIDTATYFSLPRGIQARDFPNAAQASQEVILLPIGRSIRETEIAEVARLVSEACSP